MLDIADLVIDAVGLAQIVGSAFLARLILNDIRDRRRKKDGDADKHPV
jgi:hypothetical protein